MIIFRNEPVEIERIEGGSAEDAFIASAYWTKTGIDLTDSEIAALSAERPDAIQETWMDLMIDKAERRYELLRDEEC